MLESLVMRLLCGGVIGLFYGQVSLLIMLWVLRKEQGLGASGLPYSEFLLCYVLATGAMLLISVAERFFDLMDDLEPLKMGAGVVAPLLLFRSAVNAQPGPLNKEQWFYLGASAAFLVLVAWDFALRYLPRRIGPPEMIRRRELLSAWIDTVPLKRLIWFFDGPAHMHRQRLLLRFGKKERRREIVEALCALVLVAEIIHCRKCGLPEQDRPFAASCYNLWNWKVSLDPNVFLLTGGTTGEHVPGGLLAEEELATLTEALAAIREGNGQLRATFENAGFKLIEP